MRDREIPPTDPFESPFSSDLLDGISICARWQAGNMVRRSAQQQAQYSKKLAAARANCWPGNSTSQTPSTASSGAENEEPQLATRETMQEPIAELCDVHSSPQVPARWQRVAALATTDPDHARLLSGRAAALRKAQGERRSEHAVFLRSHAV